jgi:hypothetical protein
MDTSRIIEAVIDRFDNGLALMLTEDGKEISCPKGLLPECAAEGDVIRLSITIDRRRTQERVADTQRLIDGS